MTFLGCFQRRNCCWATVPRVTKVHLQVRGLVYSEIIFNWVTNQRLLKAPSSPAPPTGLRCLYSLLLDLIFCKLLRQARQRCATHHMLFHIRAHNTPAPDLHLDGLAEDPASQGLHGPGEGGREHDSLAVGPHVVHDAHHLRTQHRLLQPPAAAQLRTQPPASCTAGCT